jgi:hypothetical protein
VEFRVLREERVQTRLAGGRPGTLPRAAVRDTLAAIRDFLSALRPISTGRLERRGRSPVPLGGSQIAPSALPHTTLSVVHIPTSVEPRFVPLPAPPGQHAFMLLEDVVRLHLPSAIYHGYEILGCHAIRVTRDAEVALSRSRHDDLLAIVEAGVPIDGWAPPTTRCRLPHQRPPHRRSPT